MFLSMNASLIFGDKFAKAKIYSPRSEACRKFQKILKKYI